MQLGPGLRSVLAAPGYDPGVRVPLDGMSLVAPCVLHKTPQSTIHQTEGVAHHEDVTGIYSGAMIRVMRVESTQGRDAHSLDRVAAYMSSEVQKDGGSLLSHKGVLVSGVRGDESV